MVTVGLIIVLLLFFIWGAHFLTDKSIRYLESNKKFYAFDYAVLAVITYTTFIIIGVTAVSKLNLTMGWIIELLVATHLAGKTVIIIVQSVIEYFIKKSLVESKDTNIIFNFFSNKKVKLVMSLTIYLGFGWIYYSTKQYELVTGLSVLYLNIIYWLTVVIFLSQKVQVFKLKREKQKSV